MQLNENFYHIPVFKSEATDFLVQNKNGIYVDGTLGGGGHSEEILKKISNNGKLIAIDQDEDAINFAKNKLSVYKNKIEFVRDNFSNIKNILESHSIKSIDGILLDLGVSSFQIDKVERGFSFMKNAKLDMRMNKNQVLNAETVLNHYEPKELEKIFRINGEIKESKILAKIIEKVRLQKNIASTEELKNIIEKNFKGPFVVKLIAKVFQSLRIFINDELNSLEKCLDDVFSFINPNGRIVVISYHSLEDRIVKNFFNSKVNPKIEIDFFSKTNYGKSLLKIISKKPILPIENEIENNPRSRSAKMRIAEKI